MAVAEIHANEQWTDLLGNNEAEVEIGSDGYAMFQCSGTSVSVWVNKEAPGRDQFGKL